MTTISVSAREPFIDPRTGQLSRFGLRVISDIVQRLGGSSGADVSAIEALLTQAIADIGELDQLPPSIPAVLPDDLAPRYQESARVEELETQVRALAERVAALMTEIDGLKQGLTP